MNILKKCAMRKHERLFPLMALPVFSHYGLPTPLHAKDAGVLTVVTQLNQRASRPTLRKKREGTLRKRFSRLALRMKSATRTSGCRRVSSDGIFVSTKYPFTIGYPGQRPCRAQNRCRGHAVEQTAQPCPSLQSPGAQLPEGEPRLQAALPRSFPARAPARQPAVRAQPELRV